jgi:hypothetical protein
MSYVLVLLVTIDVVVVLVRLVLTCLVVVPLPLLLYLRGVRLQGRLLSWLQHDPNQDYISTYLFYIYFYRHLSTP